MRTQVPGGGTKRDKRQAVMAAARSLFARYGFDRTTMDAVANCAGVSKVTVYAYFADKDSLFRAALEASSQEMADRWARLPDSQGSLQQCLGAAAIGILDAEDAPMPPPPAGGASRPHRTPASPGFADALRLRRFRAYDGAMQAVLRHAVSEGALAIEDVAGASAQFFGLVMGGMNTPAGSGQAQGMPVQARDAYVLSCVALFMRGYRC